MKLKLTAKTVAKLRAPTGTGKSIIYWDEAITGFGVLCSARTNRKVYVAQRGLPDGRSRRVTIAACNEMEFIAAKDEACALLVDLRKGIDPKRKTAVTLAGTLAAYLRANKTLHPRTARVYSHLVAKYLAPWQERSLATITPAEVDSLHARPAHNGPTVMPRPSPWPWIQTRTWVPSCASLMNRPCARVPVCRCAC
jgi:hypothetical protein